MHAVVPVSPLPPPPHPHPTVSCDHTTRPLNSAPGAPDLGDRAAQEKVRQRPHWQHDLLAQLLLHRPGACTQGQRGTKGSCVWAGCRLWGCPRRAALCGKVGEARACSCRPGCCRRCVCGHVWHWGWWWWWLCYALKAQCPPLQGAEAPSKRHIDFNVVNHSPPCLPTATAAHCHHSLLPRLPQAAGPPAMRSAGAHEHSIGHATAVDTLCWARSGLQWMVQGGPGASHERKLREPGNLMATLTGCSIPRLIVLCVIACCAVHRVRRKGR